MITCIYNEKGNVIVKKYKTVLPIIAFSALSSIFLILPNKASASTVTVKQGDTLWGYSQEYKVPVSSIMNENHISDGKYMIWPGDKINIPDGKENEAGAQFTNHFVETVTPKVYTYSKPITPPVQQNVQKSVPIQSTTTATSSLSSTEAIAKAAIAYRESRGSYTAQNGRYYGRYQIDTSYLNGDLSVANQEKVADQYVKSRYTTWTNALAHSNVYGWY